MHSKTFKALVVGNLTHDSISGSLNLGGSAYYCSQVYKALGADVTLLTNIGEDFLFSEIFEDINFIAKKTGNTTHFENFYKENGSRVQKCYSNCSIIKPDLINFNYTNYDVLHLAPVLGEINLTDWNRVNISKYKCIGIQGFIKKKSFNEEIIPHSWLVQNEHIKNYDVAFMSDEDLIFNEHIFPKLIDNISIVVKTIGEKGCEIFHSGNKIQMGVYKTKPIDPTGAGDSFSAAFMYGMIQGLPIIECGKLASAVASIVIEGHGGRTLNDVNQFNNRLYSRYLNMDISLKQ